MATEAGVASKLKTYLGESAYEELRFLAAKALDVKKTPLSIGIPPNLIFVPGVMGSVLKSENRGGIWWIDVRTRHHLKDLKLAPDGQRDVDPAFEIMPCAVDFLYEPFFTAVDESQGFHHRTFYYDWRKPLELSANMLRDQVNETYAKNGNEPVHVVAHSMGGLMIRAALMKYGTEMWPKIDRIALLGTAHYGLPTISGYLKNHLWGCESLAILGLYLDRETFRSLWGVLSVLPAPRGIYPGTRPGDSAPWKSSNASDPYLHPCANFDMYQAEKWDLELTPKQTHQLQGALDSADRFHKDLYSSHLALGQDQRDRMAVIAGVGYETLFRLAYKEHLGGLWTSMEKVKSRVPGDPHRDGDGRVPVASAVLENVGELRYVKGIHGDLPMIQEVYDDVFRWLKKEPMKLPRTPNDALESPLAGGAPVSDAPHLTHATTVNPATGDPGYWDLDSLPPDPLRASEIEAQLAKEELPAFNRIRLL